METHDKYVRQRLAWKVQHRYKEAAVGRAELVLYVADGITAIRETMKGGRVREGDRVMQLRVDGQLWMSDSDDEYRDHLAAIRLATGRVLVHGLGLGCYLSSILTKEDVTHVDVVERDPDVIALVGPYFAADTRVRIIQADAFDQAGRWPKGIRWDYAWHDIWANKCTDDLSEHAVLLRSFARRAVRQGAWCHEWLQWRRSGKV